MRVPRSRRHPFFYNAPVVFSEPKALGSVPYDELSVAEQLTVDYFVAGEVDKTRKSDGRVPVNWIPHFEHLKREKVLAVAGLSRLEPPSRLAKDDVSGWRKLGLTAPSDHTPKSTPTAPPADLIRERFGPRTSKKKIPPPSFGRLVDPWRPRHLIEEAQRSDMATRFVNADQRRRMAELKAKAEAEQKKAAEAIRQQRGEKEAEKRTARAPSTAEGSTGGAAGSSKDKGKQKEVVSEIRRKARSQGPPPSERATAPPVSADPVVIAEDPEDAPLVKRPRREREPRVSDTAIGDMTGLSQVSFPGVFPEFFSLNTSEFFVASEDSKDLDEVDSVVQDRPSARTSSSAQGPLESLAGLDAEAASRRKEVLRAQLRQEEKLVGPFTTNLNEFMSAFPRGDTDILRKAVRETGQVILHT